MLNLEKLESLERQLESLDQAERRIVRREASLLETETESSVPDRPTFTFSEQQLAALFHEDMLVDNFSMSPG